MKKISIGVLSLLLTFSATYASYEDELIRDFITSPNYEEILEIQDPVTRFCELKYFEAYRVREFNDFEMQVCGEFFIRKMEGEYLYKKMVLGSRGI